MPTPAPNDRHRLAELAAKHGWTGTERTLATAEAMSGVTFLRGTGERISLRFNYQNRLVDGMSSTPNGETVTAARVATVAKWLEVALPQEVSRDEPQIRTARDEVTATRFRKGDAWHVTGRAYAEERKVDGASAWGVTQRVWVVVIDEHERAVIGPGPEPELRKMVLVLLKEFA